MQVALRKESVDRNRVAKYRQIPPRRVALRKESVDRNTSCTSIGRPKRLSLSARRAWIEIKYVVKDSDFSGSLSARRAWIEIPKIR